jgi:hypothetical protein
MKADSSAGGDGGGTEKRGGFAQGELQIESFNRAT